MDNEVAQEVIDLIPVGSSTNTKNLANCIYAELTKKDNTTLRCIGAGANNQAVKAICIASGRFLSKGYRLTAELSFSDIQSVADPNKLISAIEYKLILVSQ